MAEVENPQASEESFSFASLPTRMQVWRRWFSEGDVRRHSKAKYLQKRNMMLKRIEYLLVGPTTIVRIRVKIYHPTTTWSTYLYGYSVCSQEDRDKYNLTYGVDLAISRALKSFKGTTKRR